MQRITLLVLLALASCVAGLAPFHDYPEKVADEYIIVLQPGLTEQDLLNHMSELKKDIATIASVPEANSIIQHWVIGSFLGIHAKLSPDMLARERSQEDVAYIDVNGIAHIAQDDKCVIQEDVIWNLARVNEHEIDFVSDEYSYQFTGEGVDAFIIDTGIRLTHVDFRGRARWGTNTVNDGQNTDCNGHGTHVASTTAGAEWGVAKGATLIAVKVLGCSGSGSWAGVISGIQWVINNRTPGRRSVANMSLGGGFIQSVNDATNAAVDAGVVMVVAAGNSNADACTFSPASATKAISVVATTVVQQPGGISKDQRASFSNFGSCTHIAAPGQLIKAAWHTSDTATNTISGTSMAAPHVAGAVAVVLNQNSGLSPAQVLQTLREGATKGAVDLACGGRAACLRTPNDFLYTYTCDL